MPSKDVFIECLSARASPKIENFLPFGEVVTRADSRFPEAERHGRAEILAAQEFLDLEIM